MSRDILQVALERVRRDYPSLGGCHRDTVPSLRSLANRSVGAAFSNRASHETRMRASRASALTCLASSSHRTSGRVRGTDGTVRGVAEQYGPPRSEREERAESGESTTGVRKVRGVSGPTRVWNRRQRRKLFFRYGPSTGR
jgi:hypothetical protein